MVKICLFHNQITPYRLPIFNEIGKNHHLFVVFYQTRSEDRFWEASIEGYSFDSVILKHFKIGPFIINYSLPSFLLKNSFDLYIIGENPENIFSEFIICLYSKISQKKFIIWSEATSTSVLLQRYKKIPNRWIIQLIYDRLSSIYQRFLYLFADAFIAYSKGANTYLMERGVGRGKIFSGGQSYPPLQENKKKSVGYHTQKNEEKKTILYLGYLRFEKGVDVLIEAFQKIKRTDSILVISGDGPELPLLKDQSSHNDSIVFTGYVDEDTKVRLYSSADIFVLPTFHDPWGLTVNEAMSYGLPIIVTSAAACSDYLIQGNGIIVKPGDVDELAQALNYLLNNQVVRVEMGNLSLKIISKYDIISGTKPLLDAIDNVFRDSIVCKV